MQRELWRYVKGYGKRYRVSNRGRVVSLHYGKKCILKPSINHIGQFVVCLSCNGYTETIATHILVKQAFGKQEITRT